MNFLKWLIDIVFGWIPYVPKATWNLIKFDLTGSKPYRIRLVIFYLGLLWMGMSYMLHNESSNDFSTPCPPYEELHEDSGMLDEWRNHQVVGLRLVRPDGLRIDFDQERTLYRVIKKEWFYDNEGNHVSVPVTIKWFPLPSGRGWITELTLNGKKLVSYEQRCKDIKEMGHRIEESYQYDFISFAIALLMIILEARSLKNKIFKGE